MINDLCSSYPGTAHSVINGVSTIVASTLGYYSGFVAEASIAISLSDKYHIYMIPVGILTAGSLGYLLPGGNLASGYLAAVFKGAEWLSVKPEKATR